MLNCAVVLAAAAECMHLFSLRLSLVYVVSRSRFLAASVFENVAWAVAVEVPTVRCLPAAMLPLLVHLNECYLHRLP